MAKEALSKIAEAESAGKLLKQQAAEEAKKILADAKADGEILLQNELVRAKEDEKKLMDDTRQKVKEIINKANIEAQASGENLKKLIDNNKDTVAEGVIKLLV